MNYQIKTLDQIKIDIRSHKDRPYVYILFDPDGIPFYVGKGVKNRIGSHESETKSYFVKNRTWRGINYIKIHTIQKIWNQGGLVGYAIDGFFDTEEQANDREIKLISSIGRKIFNEGTLTNIKDGGTFLSDEIKLVISNKLKKYCQDNPEFITNLMEAKERWIEENPEAYEDATARRLATSRSDEFRQNHSELMSIYYQENPEEVERMKQSVIAYWEDNDEAREAARQRAIDNESHENLARWRKEKPEEFVEKQRKHSDEMKEWYEQNPEKAEKMVEARNKVLKSDSHRKKMAKKTKAYIEANPDASKEKVAKMHKATQEGKKIRKRCLLVMQKHLMEQGLIDELRDEVTYKMVNRWKKKGWLSTYFPPFPVGCVSKKVWESFEIMLYNKLGIG